MGICYYRCFIMLYGRKANTEEEKQFIKDCITEGKKNYWINNSYDPEFNNDSFCVIEDINELEEFFFKYSWCVGTAVIYKDCCFIQQDNGGDEWLTIKKNYGAYESVTFKPSIKEGRFKAFLNDIMEME